MDYVWFIWKKYAGMLNCCSAIDETARDFNARKFLFVRFAWTEP